MGRLKEAVKFIVALILFPPVALLALTAWAGAMIVRELMIWANVWEG